jgi:hypothetical protein
MQHIDIQRKPRPACTEIEAEPVHAVRQSGTSPSTSAGKVYRYSAWRILGRKRGRHFDLAVWRYYINSHWPEIRLWLLCKSSHDFLLL